MQLSPWRVAMTAYVIGAPLSAFQFARITKKEGYTVGYYSYNDTSRTRDYYTHECFWAAVGWPLSLPALLGKRRADRELKDN